MTKDLLPVLAARQKGMIEQLHYLCEMNSGTYNLAGLERIREVLADLFAPIADKVSTIDPPPLQIIDMEGNAAEQHCGKVLFIQKRPHLKRRILLTGHMDTVYGPHDSFQKLRYINDNCINGPGVADMKGGLIVMYEALRYFEQSPLVQTLGWDIVINADEEIGSPVSGPLFNQIASNYQAGLIYEPAMNSEGLIAKNRRGSAKFTLVARGRAAHVGRAFNEGRNAIAYLAETIGKIHALNNLDNGININVGKIAGGTALNVVPECAVAKFDIRIGKPEDEIWVREQFDRIIKEMKRDDFSLTLEGRFGRPVKCVNHATERLFARIQAVGRQLGLTLDWKDSGGCCDGNNLAQQGLPVIDTLGVRGGHIHSHDEFILLDSLVERAALSCLILHDLAEGGLEELHQ